jgi:hypothetical protein
MSLDIWRCEMTIKVIVWHFNGPSPLIAYSYNFTGFLMTILLISILLMMLNLNTNDSNNYQQEC